ncbi:MAG: EthD family reductase [Acidimicrobiia bacterium]
MFLADPGLEDATTVDANVALSGEGPVTFVAVLFRRPDVDHSFFSRYWRETHIRFGYLIPKAKSYIQMHAVEGAPFDGVCEVAFDSVADLKAGLHAEIIAVDARADEEQFIDHRRSYGMVCVRERDSSASDFEASQS